MQVGVILGDRHLGSMVVGDDVVRGCGGLGVASEGGASDFLGEGRRPLYWLFSGTYCVFSVVDESEGNIMFLMQRNTFDHHHLNVVPLHV